jgi:hypothetical protein
MTWPNLTANDLEGIIRTYLNEVTAKFYTQAEIWRWLSAGASDISDKASCVQRFLYRETGANVRTVEISALKAHYVEYIPLVGRSIMLTQIDPLKVGNYPLTPGSNLPKYWYEYGERIGIEPLPTAIYPIRVYVSDLAKMVSLTFETFSSGAGATQWTAGAGWVCGDNAIHSGASSNLTYNTALTENSNYTLEYRVVGASATGSMTIYLGTNQATTITEDGYYMESMEALGAAPALKITAANDIIIEELYVYKEVDYAATTDQIELESGWQHLLALYATMNGLIKNKEPAAAQLLQTIYSNELAYVKQNLINITPSGRDDIVYK